MAQANGGAAVPQVDGAAVADGEVPLVNGAVLQQMDDTRGQVAAPVAGPPVADVAGIPFPQGLAPARFDVDGVLLGPLPTKSNESCKILPKIPGETGNA